MSNPVASDKGTVVFPPSVPPAPEAVDSSLTKPRISPTRFAVAVTAIYFAVAMFGALHHEMWNDEFQAWLIARDSANLLELLSNIRYEGSGPLWYLLLYPLAQLNHNPVSMQVLHVSIASACVYLVTRYAPFAWYQKLLLPLGYFFLFEYSLISRSYVLGNLLIFLFCVAYQHRKNLFTLYGLLSLLALTNVFSTIFSVALGVGLLVDRFIGRKDGAWSTSDCEPQTASSTTYSSPPRSGKRVRLVAGAVSFVVAVGACILFMLPPRDGYMHDWQNSFGQRISFREPTAVRDLARAMGIPLYSYVPIPATDYHFWETSIFRTDFFTIPNHWLVLSIALVLSFLVCLRSYPFAACSYLMGTLAVVAFSYLILTGAMRHFGQVYILLIACLWIAGFCRSTTKDAERSFSSLGSSSLNSKQSRSTPVSLNSGYSFNKITKFGGILFGSILALQAVVGLYCFSVDLRYPFSNSKAVAEYLKSMGWDKEPICAHSINGVGVCALLDRSIFQYNDLRVGSFWQSRKEKPRDSLGAIRAIRNYSPHSRSIVIMNRMPRKMIFRVMESHHTKKFRGAIVPTENRYLWVVSPRKNRLKTR